ncbi:MAG: hypothetical protein VX519_08035 [Myxococcota bacterium]|nr:hypothetical protein [Myxococcota bacterium]
MDDFFAAMRLSALLDNTLEEEEKTQVEQAIRESPRLRVQYSRMMTAVELVRSQGNADPPAILEQKILDRLRSDGTLKAPWSEHLPTRKTLLIAGAVVAVIGLTWWSWPRTPQTAMSPLPEEESLEEALATPVELKESPVLPTAPPEVVRMKKKAAPTKKPSFKPVPANTPVATPAPAATPAPVATPSRTTPKAIRGVVPQWEDEAEELPIPEAEIGSGITRLRLFPTQTNALYELEQWASQQGISLNTPARTLSTEDNLARLKFTATGGQIVDLLNTLQRLGPLHQVEPPDAHLGEATSVPVEIEVQYQP